MDDKIVLCGRYISSRGPEVEGGGVELPSNKIIRELRACLHEVGGPQVGVVACGGLPHLTSK